MGRLRRSLVQKLLRAADSPFFELPAGWHVLSRWGAGWFGWLVMMMLLSGARA
jgi:hypothetical protein